MQTLWNRFLSPVRFLATGISLALISFLVLCVSSAPANAVPAPLPIVVSQNYTLNYFPAGGWTGSQSPLSGTFVVGANGDVIISDQWGGAVLEMTPGGTETILASLSGWNPGPTAIDSYGNVYVAAVGYDSNIYKIPYNASAGTYAGFSTAPTATCLGGTQDTAPCLYAPNFGKTVFTNGQGYADLLFDASGNLFIATSANPTNNKNSIYECDATCQTSATGTPALIYADANAIGALAIDPWGNLFFSDGANSTGSVTYLKELPYQSGSYASSPTTLESYTNAAGYGNGFSGVAVSATGTVYFATNADGIFAIPNTQTGGPNLAGMYGVGTGGGYGITLDTKGNVYLVHYAGTVPSGYANYAVDKYLINNLSLGATAIGGAATTVTANVIDSNGPCTPTLALAASEFGAASGDFTVTPGSSCSAALGTSNGTLSPAAALTGSVTSATITFNPAGVGVRRAALTIHDSTSSANGVAALTGVGQGVLPTLDPGVMTAFSTGFTAPASVVADPAGDVFVADSSASKVYEIAQGTTTPVAIGSGFSSPTALAFDAYGNLFVADDGVPEVEKIANTSTSGGFTAGAQTTVVSSTFLFGGSALKDAMGLAIGPSGTLYIADTGNQRVVGYNPATGQGAVTNATAGSGLAKPMGLALDSSSNLYVADSSANKVFIFSNLGGFTSVAPPGVGQTSGVAVDASGSILVSDATSGVIVRIPNLSGTLTTTKADTIETIAPQASSVWLDSLGNMYVASAGGKSVYAIQRTQAAIDLGTVQNGLTNSGTVFLENAGNETATLGTPAVTQPANTMFTLAASAHNGCADGSTGPAGASCQLTATFAPLVGTANGLQTGTAGVNLATPSMSLTVNLSGTATQSSILAQTITNFNPPPTMQVGQQTTLSATGGDSGNPVVFTIDAASPCPTCASINGNILTALGVGTVVVDANQAGGTSGGNQYAAAQQVQATIVISNNVVPVGVPAITMNQQNWLSALPNGGAFAAASAAGTSFGVNANGNALLSTAYGGSVVLYNTSAGTWTNLGSYGKYNNTGGVALDSAGNLYVAALYSGIVVKIPYNNGAYAPVTDATSGTAPANCTGTDTTECVVAGVSNTTGIAGIASMTFDSQGDLFLATDDQGAAHSIWECTAACMASTSGSPAPVMLFQEPASSTPATTGQLYLGGIAVDPWGNVFFTDSNLINQANTSNNESSYSDVYYLPTSTGTGFNGATTGYAAAPTLLQTLTVASPGAYDDEIDAVAVGADGTVYYAAQYDGIFAIPNTQTGGPNASAQYVVSGQGAKEIALDAHGNFFYVSYHSGDTLGQVLTSNNLITPIAQLSGAPVTAPANVIDNAFTCSTAATLAIASSNSQFSATAGTNCSGISAAFSKPVAASSYPATITFAATAGGPQTSTLNISDTTNGGTGTATVTGIGQETPQTLTYTAPTTTAYTYTPGLTITVSVTNGGSNNPATFTVDSSSTGAGTFSSTTVTGTTSTATLTVTQAGTIVIDANEAGGLVNGIYYDNATQAQLTLTINQAAQTIVFPQPNSPVTYAAAPNNTTVQLSANGGDSGNPVVFTVDPSSTGAGTISTSTVSGGTSTATLTVTQAGNIVVDANQAGNTNYAAATQVQQTVVVNQASQTITFIPLTQPFHYIAGGVTLTIQATGGGSNNPIVFTVDPASTMTGSFSASTVSGSTSTAVLTIPAQTASSGIIVIDATQSGNVNYLDAAQAQETIEVLAPLPTQTITFSNPGTQVVGTPLTLTATASSGFPVDYTASPSSVCTVSGSTATFVAAGTCTIVASQPGDNLYFAAAPPVTQSFTVNPQGQVPSMTLDLSLSSLTIQRGTVGLTQLTITSVNNFTGPVTFSCSGQSGLTCTFNPSTVTVGENATATTALTVTPSSTSAAVRHNFQPLFPVTFAFALCFMGFKKRNRLHLLLLFLVALTGFGLLTGCGGTSSSAKTQPTTSSITVTATSGSTTVTKTLQVIVQ